ncbi:hypothetical protein CEXT_607061, partial [Caerostris extrusa]
YRYEMEKLDRYEVEKIGRHEMIDVAYGYRYEWKRLDNMK